MLSIVLPGAGGGLTIGVGFELKEDAGQVGPVGSAVLPFTAELKGDVGLSSAINSIVILCSVVIIVVLLGKML